MAIFKPGLRPVGEPRDKGLKPGALGLVSSVVMGVASTAPAYSLAATLFFVVAAVGLKSPLVAVLAFVPMLLCSIGFSELNKADPDCGTTFIWAARAFGPKTGWAGGWGVVAADVLVMASLAQVAGQYLFFLLPGTGQRDRCERLQRLGAAGRHVLWIVAMTYICYRGIEVSANFQKALLSIEIIMLLVMSVTALVRVLGSHPPPGRSPELQLAVAVAPARLGLLSGMHLDAVHLLGLGHRLVGERGDREQVPDAGPAAIISTVLLLVTYVIVIVAVQAFAGIGGKGIGLTNPATPVRRAVGHRGRDLRQLRARLGLVPAADPDGAQLGRRLDPDHDPADRTHDAVDGRLRGAARVLRQDPPQVPDPDGVHPRDGRDLDPPVHPAELHLRRQRRSLTRSPRLACTSRSTTG